MEQLSRFVNDFLRFWRERNQKNLADMILCIKEEPIAALQTMDDLAIKSYCSRACNDKTSTDILQYLLMRDAAIGRENFSEAFTHHQLLINEFTEQSTDWALPLFLFLLTDYRKIAQMADDIQAIAKEPPHHLNDAAQIFTNFFKLCLRGRRDDSGKSKQQGVLHILNNTFRICSKVHILHFSMPTDQFLDKYEMIWYKGIR
ncbi:MAG: hypothetical protein EZS28_000658, partial [Streblomastix strix]